MKLVVFVVERSKADAAVERLVAHGFRVTRLASSGGFLRRGNTTLLIGLEEYQLAQARDLMHEVAPGSLLLALDLDQYERL